LKRKDHRAEGGSVMELNIDRSIIHSIWQQLEKQETSTLAGKPTTYLSVVEQGWGAGYDIDDLLWETDGRAQRAFRATDSLKFVRDECSINFETRFEGPFRRDGYVYGTPSMRAADIANLLVQIERFGFSVEPNLLVDALRPKLLKERYLTNSELTVVWYAKQKHGFQPVNLWEPAARPTESVTIYTASGYRATALLQDDVATALRVDPPKKQQKRSLETWKYVHTIASLRKV
jgi:hypothetical protein